MKMSISPYARHCIAILASFAFASVGYANPVGFASMNGGTTGGAGGTSITVSNGADLYQALKDKQDSSTPLTIVVNGTITPGNSGQSKIDIKDVSDVTIIGGGSGARFSGIGIKLTRAHNIIIRNLIVHEVDTGDKDGISIEGSSTNIWIDHNELYSSLNVDKDYYDGLLDSKSGSEYITISYNYMHDSWKTSLHGSSDSDSGDRNITFHHNRFENLYSRGPLFRFGEGHLFNNYYNNIVDTGINSRMGARLRIENNHFQNSRNPVVSFYSNDVGYWDLRGNKLENVTWVESPADGIIAGAAMQSTTSYTPPYSYSLDNVECVKSIVLATAGAGKGLATSNGSCNVQSSSSVSSSSSSVVSSSSTPPVSSSSVASSSSSVISSASSSSTVANLGTNLALGEGADGSSKGNGTSYGSIIDGSITTYWQPSSSSGQRISVKSLTGSFNTVIIRELNGRTTAWRLVNNDNGAVLASGTTLGSQRIITGFGTISASKINLMIDSASAAPQIAEFEIYNATGSIGSSSSSVSSVSSVPSSSSSVSSVPTSSSSSSVGNTDGNAAGLIGFATLSGYGRTGTNGGQGGPVVTVSNFNALVSAVADDNPRIVQVSGTISGSGMVDVGSNKTIIGVGSNATISGFGFDINGWGPDEIAVGGTLCDPAEENTFTHVENVIVRNLSFMNAADDSINVQCYSHHVWVDHNTFYAGNDGSVDVKRGSDLVTISFNRFDGTDKTMLLGHSANNGAQDRGRLRVTYHDNWFDGSNTRSPRVRFGYAHVFNNYYDVQDYVLGLGVEAKIYAEGNYVAATKTITQDFSESTGYHLTWTSSNYYNVNTITRADGGSEPMSEWLDADGQVSAPSAYPYTLKPAPSSPPAAGAGRM